MSNQRKGNNQRRNNNQRQNNGAMAGNIKGLSGKPIKKFPVYIKDRKTGETHVIHNFNNLMAMMGEAGKAGLECLGAAPMDAARALVSANASVDVTVTRTFAVYRIVSIEDGVIHLFPHGRIVPTATWVERFKPQVGRWVVRSGKLENAHGKDGYTVVIDRIFKANYGNYMDQEALAEFNNSYDRVMAEREELKKKAAKERREAERAESKKTEVPASDVADTESEIPVAAEEAQQSALAEVAPEVKVGEATAEEAAQHAAASQETEDEVEKNGDDVDGARSLAAQES